MAEEQGYFFNIDHQKLNLRSEVYSSWKEACRLGINPEARPVLPAVDPQQFDQVKRQSQNFLHHATAQFQQLSDFLRECGCYALVVAPDGLIFDRVDMSYGNLELQLEYSKELSPGKRISFEHLGTTAFSLACQYKRPFFLCGPEFFNRHLQRTSSAAAPVIIHAKLLGLIVLHKLFDNSKLDQGFLFASAIAVSKGVAQGLLEEDLNLTKPATARERSAPWQAVYTFQDIATVNQKYMQLIKHLQRVSRSDLNILIFGENGVGKERIAHSIHNASSRREKPFVAINCAALPRELMESELFGYAEGSFTGAKRGGKIGKFELADEGTVFLDEVGDLALSAQAMLLRVLSSGEIIRIGDDLPRKLDVRIVAATNKNLEEMAGGNKFRKDLYFRLAGVKIVIPPLRERKEDIDFLAPEIVDFLNRKYSMTNTITREAAFLLKKHHWPGNIRELENLLEQAFFAEKSQIDCEVICDLLEYNWTNLEQENQITGTAITLEHLPDERLEIIDCLTKCGGNITKAARILGISRMTLYRKMKKYRITYGK